MDIEDFGKPVATGRFGRVLVGLIFILFAAIAGLIATSNLAEPPHGAPRSTYVDLAAFLVTLAAVVGYFGIRLLVMADDEHLPGRKTSIVAPIILIVGA